MSMPLAGFDTNNQTTVDLCLTPTATGIGSKLVLCCVLPINTMARCGVVLVASERDNGYLQTGKGHVGPLKAGNCLPPDTARYGTRVFQGFTAQYLPSPFKIGTVQFLVYNWTPA
jgi:hypothetical protein